MEVTINWGGKGATKKIKLVRSDAPGSLVFQSLRSGAPMSDHNILSRHIKPAAKKLGLGPVNWQVLRRSYATWLGEAGADPKAIQGQMRHSRISTTMDIYRQFVPSSQRRAVTKLSEMLAGNVSNWDEMGRKGRSESSQVIEKLGGASRDRTDDLIVANDALSQLSYSPTRAWLNRDAGARTSEPVSVIIQTNAGTQRQQVRCRRNVTVGALLLSLQTL
jgi:hypothetical protein